MYSIPVANRLTMAKFILPALALAGTALGMSKLTSSQQELEQNDEYTANTQQRNVAAHPSQSQPPQMLSRLPTAEHIKEMSSSRKMRLAQSSSMVFNPSQET